MKGHKEVESSHCGQKLLSDTNKLKSVVTFHDYAVYTSVSLWGPQQPMLRPAIYRPKQCGFSPGFNLPVTSTGNCLTFAPLPNCQDTNTGILEYTSKWSTKIRGYLLHYFSSSSSCLHGSHPSIFIPLRWVT
jgi:hypothetical protein